MLALFFLALFALDVSSGEIKSLIGFNPKNQAGMNAAWEDYKFQYGKLSLNSFKLSGS